MSFALYSWAGKRDESELNYTVYVFGGVFFIIMAHISDKILYRSPFIIFGLSLSLIGMLSCLLYLSYRPGVAWRHRPRS